MKQCIILVFCCIILSNVYSSAAENGNSDLAITTISYDDIGISWSKSSFSDADSYKIEVNTTGDNGGYCSKDNRTPCTGDACEIKLTVIGCNNIALPCYDVIMTVTGNGVDHEPEIISTTVAPYFPPADWKLAASIKDGESKLTVNWGALTGDFASCATNALITATCVNANISKSRVDLVPASESTTTVDLKNCTDGLVTDVTVTYMSGDIPTETKMTYDGEDLVYTPATTTTEVPTTSTTEPPTSPPILISCYECFANNSKCFEDFEGFGSEKIFRSCFWTNTDGDTDLRGGLDGPHKDETIDNTKYCSYDLCNAASTNLVTMTLLSVVPLFLHFLLQ